MNKAKKALTKLITLSSLLIAAFTASASIESAKRDYENREYKAAFKEFMKYARIGNPQAQYYIGMMYYQGKGVSSDIYEANAWFGLSRQGGFRNSIDMMQRLRRELPSKREAKVVAQELESLYSQDILTQSLFPNFTLDDAPDKQLTPLQIKNPNSTSDSSGWALVSVTIDENGNVSNEKIFNSYPEGVFDRASLNAAKGWKFKPQMRGDEMVQVDDYIIKFEFRSSNVMAHQSYLRSLSKYSDSLASRARSGDAEAQYLLARLHGQGIIRPRMSDKIRSASAWLLEAAKSGHPAARYDIAERLLEGRGVVADPVKAYKWLKMSAEEGYAPAQYAYAKEVIRSNAGKDEYAQAVKYLISAADAGNGNAEQELAIVYSTSIHYEYFLPFKSSLIGKDGLNEDKNHPDYLMILGAAYSAQGSNEKAGEFLSNAYSNAISRGWPTARIMSVAQQLGVDISAQGYTPNSAIAAAPAQTQPNTQQQVQTPAPQVAKTEPTNKKFKRPNPIDRIGPIYPVGAEEDGIEGWVKLSYSVNRNGLVEDILVISSEPEEIFDQAAIDALKQWRYEPIIENGTTVKRTGFKVKLAFNLDQE
ncbi:TonB family protein [Catenovulum sp. SM1970]|uniref:TonB family protein n=1 Tax=Marinifaba aquimaris TaxID=2741323 RepID=UPI0015728A26|nr:TonB family protein [Marinifaba aquimaris]NTS76092.1 TonB family protein [Marinifaba aquimaris]